MPRIFDNIELELLPALRQTLKLSQRSDFCVGYFNLRGWKAIDALIEQWPGGEGAQCRLLIGMQRLAQDELRHAYSLLPHEDQISQQTVIRLKRRLAEEFRAQLTFGAPTDEDEAGLRRLSAHLKSGKVVVKLFLRQTLHAKLYLCFMVPDDVVGIRPEEYLRRDCDGRPDEFTRRHQCAVNCLSAFEKSEHADDWRELMRLFMVRRTRSLVERNYALTECPNCAAIVAPTQEQCPQCGRPKAEQDRRFLVLEGGSRFHFPKRRPKTLTFRIRDRDPSDRYARLYSDRVVDTVRLLHLPRYGLANYLKPTLDIPPTQAEADIMGNLSRAGRRLIGFCRTNLFKRLESSGHSFLLSVRRHILRNFVYLHALEQGLPLPVGTQDSALFDTRADDRDSDSALFGGDEAGAPDPTEITAESLADFARAGASGYHMLGAEHAGNFDWLRPDFFVDDLAQHLRQDSQRLFSILELAGPWQPDLDHKLAELHKLVAKNHPGDKILIFSQFADTVSYLAEQLRARGVKAMADVTGDTEDPSTYARRFSPESSKALDKSSPRIINPVETSSTPRSWQPMPTRCFGTKRCGKTATRANWISPGLRSRPGCHLNRSPRSGRTKLRKDRSCSSRFATSSGPPQPNQAHDNTWKNWMNAQVIISSTDSEKLASFRHRLGPHMPTRLCALDNLDLLALPMTAPFCSARCPGNVILSTYDQAAKWRDAGHCVISGSHSPVEKECLQILLHGRGLFTASGKVAVIGTQPIIIYPARALPKHVPPDLKTPLTAGRLLILSAFALTASRVTAELAALRNEFVAAMPYEVYIAHTTPGGRLDFNLRSRAIPLTGP